jgi:NADH:ubiquinone oxidoreductase subunit 6 (subunit J)
MNPKAPDLLPPNYESIVLVDPLPCFFLIKVLVLIVAVIVLVWAVWTGWKCKGDVKQFEVKKRKLIFWATALLFAGTVDCLYDVAIAFFILAQSNATKASVAISSISIAESLFHYIPCVAVSGIMFLVSLTMPWKRKNKDNSDATPSQESER